MVLTKPAEFPIRLCGVRLCTSNPNTAFLCLEETIIALGGLLRKRTYPVVKNVEVNSTWCVTPRAKLGGYQPAKFHFEVRVIISRLELVKVLTGTA